MQKHGQIVLAVLGVILMLTWMVPSQLKSWNDSAKQAVGKLNGTKVTNQDLINAENELKILDSYGGSPRFVDARSEYRAIHWYLIQQEAAKYGLSTTDAEVTAALTAVTNALHVTDTQLDDMLEKMSLTRKGLGHVLGRRIVATKLFELARGSLQTSVPEIEAKADEFISNVEVRYTSLDGTQGWESMQQPTEEQLKRHFDLYKGVEPTPTGRTPPEIDGHHFPFGYKYGDRVQVEYIRFDRASLLAKFQPTAEDYEVAYRKYTAHPEKFPNPEREKGTASIVSTQPAFLPFEKVRDQLVADEVNTRVDKFLKKITDVAMRLAADPWKDAPTPKGYKEDVPQSKWADYKVIVATINANREFEGYQASYQTKTGWLDRAALNLLEGIGSAKYVARNDQYSLADLALHVRELNETKDNLSRMYLQVGTEGPLMQDNGGNLYMYRLVAAEKSHEPKSLDEVRERVVTDVKRLEAYQRKQADAKKLAEAAVKEDLIDLAKKAGLEAQKSPQLARAKKGDLSYEIVPGFIEAAFSLVPPQATAATQPTTQVAETGKTPTRTLNDDADLRVFVLAFNRYSPVSPMQFASARGIVMMQIGTETFDLNEQSGILRFLGVPPDAAKEIEDRHYGRDRFLRFLQENGVPPEFLFHLREYDFALDWINLESVAKRLTYVPIVPFAKPKTGEG